MCLSTITSRRTGTNLQVTKVWKIFQIDKKHTCTMCNHTSRSEDRIHWKLKDMYDRIYSEAEIGVWIKASKGEIKGYNYGKLIKYPKGFHGYVAGKNYWDNVIPVEFRRIHTVGTQAGNKILVAYEMRIPKNWRKYVDV